MGIKKLFSHLFPSAKLPTEAEQHPLYQDYGFPHVGILFLSFSACQQTELSVMKVENKACVRPYLFTYIKSIYLHEGGKWDISCVWNYEQHKPVFQKMTHLSHSALQVKRIGIIHRNMNERKQLSVF